MDAIETILTRRSVRKFISDRDIPDESLDILLQAGMSAPSARNGQPWHFLVVTDRTMLNRIAEVHPYARMCMEAPLAIISCVDHTILKSNDTFWIQDMSAATENIMLAARALGLGSVWLGVFPDQERADDIGKLFSLPHYVTAFNIIPIGFSDVEQKAVERYHEDRVHYEKW